MFLHFLMVISCFAVVGVPLQTKEARDEGAVERPTREQCDAWVQQLANRGERPFKESYVLKAPRNVDRKALADVKVAYDALSRHFSEALPSLIAGISDKRYSYYQEVPSNGAFVCHSVGIACRDIIRAHVEVPQRFVRVLDESGLPRTVHFIEKQGGIEKWYADRKDKSLFELQLEAVDWALTQPPDPRVDPAKWEKGVAALRKFREEFVKNKQPFDPKNRLWFEGK